MKILPRLISLALSLLFVSVVFPSVHASDTLPSGTEEAVVVGISMNEIDSARSVAVFTDLQQTLERAGFSVLYRDAKGNLPQQISDIEELLSSHPDYLLVSAVKSIGLGKVLSKTYGNGTKLLFVDRFASDVEENQVLSYIGPDNKWAGKLCAEILADLTDSRDILEIQNNDGSLTTKEKTTGFRKELCNYDNEITSVLCGDTSRQSVRNQIMSLSENRGIEHFGGIFAHEDDGAIGTVFALMTLDPSRRIPIVTIGGSRDVVNAVKAGYVDCCVYSDPDFGQFVLKTIEDDLLGLPVDKLQLRKDSILIDSNTEDIGGY